MVLTRGFPPSWANNFARSRGESAYPDLWDGLVGAWAPSFGDTGGRLFGVVNGIHGTINGATWVPSGDPRIPGPVLQFDGISDYATMGDVSSLDFTSNMSLVLLARPLNTAVYQGIFGKTNGSWTLGYGLYFVSGTTARFFVDNYATNVAIGTIVIGQWHHIVGTYDNSTLRIYINGIEGTADTLAGPFTSPSGFALEMGEMGGGYKANMDIAEARLYPRVLTPAEILLDSQVSLAPFRRRLTFPWKAPAGAPAGLEGPLQGGFLAGEGILQRRLVA